MRVAIVGSGGRAAARRRALGQVAGVEVAGGFDAAVPEAVLAALDVLFIAVPTADHFALAEAATKQGVHVFLEWPPATSIRECEAVVRLAEEAGVEAGVSRPLRFHPALAALPPGWRAGLIALRYEGGTAALTRRLADAVDLCSHLARSSSVQRVDAEAVRSGAAWPEAAAVGLRFHNGVYAQVSLRPAAAAPVEHLYAAGAGVHLDVDLLAPRALVRRAPEGTVGAAAAAFEPVALPGTSAAVAETRAFLEAVAAHRTVPVSALDGLHTMRLVERLLGKLR